MALHDILCITKVISKAIAAVTVLFVIFVIFVVVFIFNVIVMVMVIAVVAANAMCQYRRDSRVARPELAPDNECVATVSLMQGRPGERHVVREGHGRGSKNVR